MTKLVLLCCLSFLYLVQAEYYVNPYLVMTVATDDNHGLERFLRSARVYGIQVEVLGKGEEWAGGDMKYPGGGHKINLLKARLDEYMRRLKGNILRHIVLFTDSYDVIFLANLEEIVSRFESSGAGLLFSAEQFCWPDPKLAANYTTTDVPNPYLNSGAFIGYFPNLYYLLSNYEIDDKDDDQLYFTKVYLNKDLRKNHMMALDHDAAIFQNLNGAYSDVELRTNTTEEWPYLVNVVTNKRPLVLHGNGPSKLTLNHLSNYLAKARAGDRCIICEERRQTLKEDALPTVLMAVFVEQATPFLEEFFQRLLLLDYPKSKLHLLLRNNVEYHEAVVEQFFVAHGNEYATAKRIKPSDFIIESEARTIAKERCESSACDYLFSVDSLSRLESGALRHLLGTGFDVVAPLLARPGQPWSNFWGSVNGAGFYARSPDYMDIVNRVIKGTWNVPFITNCYLAKATVFRSPMNKGITYRRDELDPDMAFCASLRDLGIMMYVNNEEHLGHLINPETYDPSRTHADMYQVIENRAEWEARYLHPQYYDNFAEGREHLVPCPDVYWFPLTSMRFCKEWIEIMEAYGQWSDGSNNDKRLENGYEAVPTRDIHMTQVGLESQWLFILREYVRPLQEAVFTGYYHNPPVSKMNFVVRYRPDELPWLPPHDDLSTYTSDLALNKSFVSLFLDLFIYPQPPVSIMNFVVRYRPDEQPSLRPHHDSSTYTINLALNTPNVDYEGGGCRFLRYNCSVRDTKPGWLLMHPGRLTHYHEGLRVNNGTRYIMVSFIDP